jgi:hypothetical protein
LEDNNENHKQIYNQNLSAELLTHPKRTYITTNKEIKHNLHHQLRNSSVRSKETDRHQ